MTAKGTIVGIDRAVADPARYSVLPKEWVDSGGALDAVFQQLAAHSGELGEPVQALLPVGEVDDEEIEVENLQVAGGQLGRARRSATS